VLLYHVHIELDVLSILTNATIIEFTPFESAETLELSSDSGDQLCGLSHHRHVVKVEQTKQWSATTMPLFSV
jgi:hypothetical protein